MINVPKAILTCVSVIVGNLVLAHVAVPFAHDPSIAMLLKVGFALSLMVSMLGTTVYAYETYQLTRVLGGRRRRRHAAHAPHASPYMMPAFQPNMTLRR